MSYERIHRRFLNQELRKTIIKKTQYYSCKSNVHYNGSLSVLFVLTSRLDQKVGLPANNSDPKYVSLKVSSKVLYVGMGQSP